MNGLFQSFQNVFKQKKKKKSKFHIFLERPPGEHCLWRLNTTEEELVTEEHSVETAVCG